MFKVCLAPRTVILYIYLYILSKEISTGLCKKYSTAHTQVLTFTRVTALVSHGYHSNNTSLTTCGSSESRWVRAFGAASLLSRKYHLSKTLPHIFVVQKILGKHTYTYNSYSTRTHCIYVYLVYILECIHFVYRQPSLITLLYSSHFSLCMNMYHSTVLYITV